MSALSLDKIDELVATKAITEEQAADLAAQLRKNTETGQTAASSARQQAGRNRGRQQTAAIKLPDMPPALKVGVGGKVFSVEGQSHYRKPDGTHGLRVVPVVVVKAGKSKGVSITPELLKIIDAKRAEIDNMLKTSGEVIAKLRASAVTSDDTESADDIEMLD